jgi:hypothetical protein
MYIHYKPTCSLSLQEYYNIYILSILESRATQHSTSTEPSADTVGAAPLLWVRRTRAVPGAFRKGLKGETRNKGRVISCGHGECSIFVIYNQEIEIMFFFVFEKENASIRKIKGSRKPKGVLFARGHYYNPVTILHKPLIPP